MDEENMLTVTATKVTGRGAQRQVKIQRETPGHLDPYQKKRCPRKKRRTNNHLDNLIGVINVWIM